MSSEASRVLVIDDNVAIHGDFQKIFAGPPGPEPWLADAEELLFGCSGSEPPRRAISLAFAAQGSAGVDLAAAALAGGAPYALAFVDMRMPPGFDGLEATRRLLRQDPDIRVVICTAHAELGTSDFAALGRDRGRVGFLRKPFDALEVEQIAEVMLSSRELGTGGHQRG